MSLTAQNTPLNLNFESELLVNRGLWINNIARGYQGVWTAQQPWDKPVSAGYTQGSVTADNCTGILTDAISNFYNATPVINDTSIDSLSVVVWRNLIRIGRPTDSRLNNSRINCPGLGNSRPDEFKTSFPGYGSFDFASTTDEFGNKISGPKPGLVESIYPPYDYPVAPTSSYVWMNWSSTPNTPGAPTDMNYTLYQPWQELYQYYQEYSWITGWPGRYEWQNKNPSDPQVALDPVTNGDSYAAAYLPRPDLRLRDRNKIEYDEYFRYGFIATVARQAYYEFWSAYTDRRPNQYIEFTRSFQRHESWQSQSNAKISSYVNNKTFLKGTYSNINDLSTSDLAGVNLAFRDWGADMIALGLSIDLSSIDRFGLPSKFLLNLQKCNALTTALAAALLLTNLTQIEVDNILNPAYSPTIDEERRIYAAMQLIVGQDLEDILVILNCTTQNLSSLADLINPIKMFPNSYPSLTVPEYNLAANSAKVYRFIYNGNNVNTSIQNWGDYLEDILPSDLALACGAFMMAMNQVKNISNMNILQLSQVIYNLEVVDKDLPLINSADGVPGSNALSNQALARIALGSGTGGNYRFADFMGAMSGFPYRDYYEPAKQSITKLQTEYLFNIYRKLYQKSLFNNWALMSRGKGWSDADINTTGIDPQYAYNLYTVSSVSAPYNRYYVFSDGPVTATVNTAGTAINTNNLFDGPYNPPRSSPGSTYPQTVNQSNYPTGTLISFVSNPTPGQIYVVNSATADTVTFQSILNYNYFTQTQGGGTLSGSTVTYNNVPSSALSDVGPGWRLDRAYVTGRSWTPNPLPNPSNLGTLIITLDTGSYTITQTTTYASPYPYPGWPGLSQEINTDDRIYIVEWEYNGYPGNGQLDGTVQNLIDAANLEILRISQENPQEVSNLNYYWGKIGRQLRLEQRAIPLSLPQCDEIYTGTNRADLSAFAKLVEQYAQNTEYCETAPILEAISDTTGIGGQSIIGSEREARNAARIASLAISLDNDVPDFISNISQQNIDGSGTGQISGGSDVGGGSQELAANGVTEAATAEPVIVDGAIVDVIITSPGSGYVPGSPPEILLYPNGGAWGCTGSGAVLGTPVIDQATGAILSIPVIEPGSDYTYDCASIVIPAPPNPNRPNPYPGTPAVPGSFSGLDPNQIEEIIPDNLTVGPRASYTVDEAIEQVTNCNCECWNL